MGLNEDRCSLDLQMAVFFFVMKRLDFGAGILILIYKNTVCATGGSAVPSISD